MAGCGGAPHVWSAGVALCEHAGGWLVEVLLHISNAFDIQGVCEREFVREGWCVCVFVCGFVIVCVAFMCVQHVCMIGMYVCMDT